DELQGEIGYVLSSWLPLSKSVVSRITGAVQWAALNSVTTVKRLIEVWPESKELLPKEADKASTALPALRVEDLNKMIGLPSEAA
ncbi:Nmad5 family putative nucleotide modification protein, partial [Escherichia coli]